jgi:hypothetical protein
MDQAAKDQWDEECAFELVMMWHDEAESIASQNADEADRRGYTEGAASWRKIAGLAAQMWVDNKDKILRPIRSASP